MARRRLTDPPLSDILGYSPALEGWMNFHQWKRREVVTLLGGTAAVWSLAMREKQVTMHVRSLVFAAVMAALLTTAAHAQLSQAWGICEGYMANPTSEQQIESCTAIIESGRETPQRLAIAYFWRAVAWRNRANLQRALADFTETIRLNPKYLGAYEWRSHLLIDRGDYDGAVANDTDAIKNLPDERDLFGYRGYAHFYRGDFPASAGDLRRAIELIPFSTHNADRAPMLYLALTRAGQDGRADLEAQVDRWKTINRDSPPIVDLLLGRSSPEAVLATAKTLRTQCETDFYVGQWHLIRNNRDEARRRLQLASTKNCDGFRPTYPGAVAELKRMVP
jgi:tetratricopeptide (TPR) repeat protein